jgi:AcrR family transcriptional regulator
MGDRTEKRRYHSPQRRQQAGLTRRQILEAARRLFATRGYAATTLPAIAREAGVSAPTITAVFGTKPALLEALIQMGVRGDTAEAPLIEQSWWQEMLAEPDPRQQLRRQAAIARQIHERSADIFEIVRGAATADPEIATLLTKQAARRLEDAKSVAEALARKSALRASMPVDQATDVLWALTAAYTYRLLVTERGWSPDQYEEWLASCMIHSVLDERQIPHEG